MIERTDFGDVTRLRMWTVRSRLVGYDVSAYVVRGTLIDTGAWHNRHDLLNAVQDMAVRGAVVTHWHEDHAGNAATLAAEGVPLWMSDYTEAVLRERPQMRFYRHWTWGHPRRLEGTVARFDPAPLQVILLPGHSVDHHVVFDADTTTLFSADLWLGVKVRIVGPTENPYQIVESLRRAIALKPARMFDAHRGLVDKPVGALGAKQRWLEDTIAAIERRLDAGESEAEITRSVLGGDDVFARFSAYEYSRRNLVRTVTLNRSRPTA